MEKIVDELLALGELANEKHKEALQDARERREAAAAKAFADGKELKKKFKPKAISAKDLVSTDLPTLTKFTFPCYYRCVFSALQSTFTEKTSRAASVFSHLASEPDSMESAFEELKSCTAMWKGLVQCSGGAIVQRALRIQVRPFYTIAPRSNYSHSPVTGSQTFKNIRGHFHDCRSSSHYENFQGSLGECCGPVQEYAEALPLASASVHILPR